MDPFKYFCFTFIVIFLVACSDQVIYNPSDTLSQLPVMEAFIDEDEYYNLLSSKTTDTEVPVKILYQGETSYGFIRSSGGGSRLHPRWNYRVKLNTGFMIEALSEFSLSSQSLDLTMIHTTIVSQLYALRGIPIFNNKHVFLKINNADEGLYLLIERIDESFFEKRAIPVYEYYKANLDSDFSFDALTHPFFTYEKKLPEDNNYDYLFEFFNVLDTCKVDNIEISLGYYLSIDDYLIYHAISSITNNNDAFQNNYYLYRQNSVTPYQFIPWDFDRAFDQERNVGIAGKNKLFDKLYKNEFVKERYLTEIQYNLDNYFREDVIFPIIDSTAVRIKMAYNIDPFLGGGGKNLDFRVNQLKEFISNRIIFLKDEISE
jgi:spore coat protein H